MRELPDVTMYIEALRARIPGQPLEKVRIASPYVLRSVDPPVSEVEGKRVTELRRLGKRIAIGLEDDLWLVVHLMIARRFTWQDAGAKIPRNPKKRHSSRPGDSARLRSRDCTGPPATPSPSGSSGCGPREARHFRGR